MTTIKLTQADLAALHEGKIIERVGGPTIKIMLNNVSEKRGIDIVKVMVEPEAEDVGGECELRKWIGKELIALRTQIDQRFRDFDQDTADALQVVRTAEREWRKALLDAISCHDEGTFRKAVDNLRTRFL